MRIYQSETQGHKRIPSQMGGDILRFYCVYSALFFGIFRLK